MCRHLAYLGPPVTLATLITEPPHGLARQSWAPRHQRHGTMNVDGFGVGWYAPGDPVPARYRRAGPIWADPCFADLARVTRSAAVLAAVRSATDGTAAGAAAAAPFASGPWLFSHNGIVAGWPGTAAAAAATLPAADLLGLEARTDSALAWALAAARLRAGDSPAGALTAAVSALAGGGAGGRLNFLLTDGSVVAATTFGDTLCYRHRDGAVVVASEPSDDEPGWTGVADRSVLTASTAGVEIRPLPAPDGVTAAPAREGTHP
jgi:ergothioneine biosynthesis protein EgtC